MTLQTLEPSWSLAAHFEDYMRLGFKHRQTRRIISLKVGVSSLMLDDKIRFMSLGWGPQVDNSQRCILEWKMIKTGLLERTHLLRTMDM